MVSDAPCGACDRDLAVRLHLVLLPWVSWERRAAAAKGDSVRVPSAVSKRYSFSTRTQGSSCRRRASSSPRRVRSLLASGQLPASSRPLLANHDLVIGHRALLSAVVLSAAERCATGHGYAGNIDGVSAARCAWSLLRRHGNRTPSACGRFVRPVSVTRSARVLGSRASQPSSSRRVSNARPSGPAM
jgi:hypothetical protein